MNDRARPTGRFLVPARVLESFCKPGLSLAGETRQFGHELSDCDIEVGVYATTVNVTARQREPRAR